MSDTRVKHVTDLAGLRALSHPLRLRLLGLLRIQGPATATSLAQRVGAAPNAVSYHLRQLARAGFIEPVDVSSGDRREHVWQASHDLTTWEPANFGGSAESRELLDALRQRVFEAYAQAIERFLRAEPDMPEAWRLAAGFGDLVFRASPADLRAVGEEIAAVVERHRQRAVGHAADPGTEDVMVIWHVFPLVTRS